MVHGELTEIWYVLSCVGLASEIGLFTGLSSAIRPYFSTYIHVFVLRKYLIEIAQENKKLITGLTMIMSEQCE
jgi:hypothetical protein